MTEVSVRFRVRRRTAASWVSLNEVLLDSELGLESDTGKFKFGDGVTGWNGLDYAPPVAFSDITGTPTTLGGYGITDAQALDTDLTALAGVGTTGLLVRTGAGAAATRAVTGTANEISVANGDGVAGAPTLSLPSALTFTGKTVTGGNYAGITLSGITTGPGGFSVDAAGQVNGGGSNAWTIGSKSGANRVDLVSGTYRFLNSANQNAPINCGNIDMNGDLLRIRTAKTPASATATGTQGQFAWDASYLYICTATDTWRRVAHATW